jgi:TM2 domain-containing membrane protein YozV
MENTMDSAGAVETNKEVAASRKSRLVALLVCMFFGWAGGHRFYAEKTGTAILMLFSMGGFGMWWFLDLVMIATGNFRDKNELPISRWTK